MGAYANPAWASDTCSLSLNIFFPSGVATTDGSTIFLLFGEDPQQTDTPHWFVCMIDVTQRTLVRGSSRSAAFLPVAFHFNPRANGTMVLSAMMHEIEGADPIQVPKQAFGVHLLWCNNCF
jgi:hypothetical protein